MKAKGFLHKFFEPAIRLTNRLRYPQKFALISILFLLPQLFGTGLLIIEINKRVTTLEDKRYGVIYARDLRTLFEHSLDSRELIHEYFVLENSSLETEVLQVFSLVDEDLNTLIELDQSLGDPLGFGEDLKEMQSAWGRIKKLVTSDEHIPGDATRVDFSLLGFIARQLALFNDIAIRSNLLFDSYIDSNYLVNKCYLSLPTDLEIISAASQIVEESLNRNELTPGEVIKLAGLHTQIGISTGDSQHRAALAFIENSNLEKAIGQAEEESRNSIRDFLLAFRPQDQNFYEFKLDSFQDFRDEALNQNFEYWDLAIEELDNLISQRLTTQKVIRALTIIFTLLMLSFVIYIWIGFYFAVMQTVSTLDDAADKMISGELGASVTLDTQDELGQVVQSFNAIAKQLRIEWQQARDESARATAAEDDAQKARKAAEEASEAKGNFLANVSHELRTPLTSVLGFAKIVKKRLDERILPLTLIEDRKTERAVKQVRQNLDIIISEGERLTTLINNVLDLAKIEAGRFHWQIETISVSDMLTQTLSATAGLFERKNLEIIQEIDADLPTIKGDKDKLIQVVINLISNAVKFTNQGSVTCRAKRVDGDIVISMIDTGTGIASQDLPKVFEKFVQVGDTLTDKPKGTGLGLPISKQIIEFHEGRIWVESVFGQGSTFSFTLPITTIDETKSHHPKGIEFNELVDYLNSRAESLKADSGNPKRILVIDDDPNVRELLHQTLEEAHYEVILAESGLEALSLIEDAQPALILLDLIMPEMSGFDVFAALKNNPKTQLLPIIVITILDEKEKGDDLKVDGFIKKPIDTELLLDEIAKKLEKAHSKRKIFYADGNKFREKTLANSLKTNGFDVVLYQDNQDIAMQLKSALPDIVIAPEDFSVSEHLVWQMRLLRELDDTQIITYH